MNRILSILIAVFVFGILIFVHELGHYIAARIFGVKIYEFSIGMGPRLVWFDSKKTGIRYKICMLPFGGYVSMAGEEEESDLAPDDPRALPNQKPWHRLIITAAGGVVNLFVGFLLMFAVVLGTPASSTKVADFPEELRIEGVSTEADGLKSGDIILSVGGRRVHTGMEMDYEIMRRGVEPLQVVVLREGQKQTLTITFPTEVQSKQVVGTRDFRVYAEKKTFSSVLSQSFYRSVCTVRMVWESLFDLATGRYGIEAVSGPVGITATVSQAASYGLFSVLYLVSVISINLGVVNLFPLPALDGGRVFFILLEMIRRKPIRRDVEARIHAIGMFLLLGLAVFITFKDIRSFF